MRSLTTVCLLLCVLSAGCRKTKPAGKPQPGRDKAEDSATTSGKDSQNGPRTVNYDGVFGPSRHVVGSEKPVGEETKGIYRDGGRPQPRPQPPDPTVAAPELEPKPTPVPPAPRSHPARGRLGLAKSYAAAGLKAKARKILQEVVKTYPDTDYATEAKELLEGL